MARPPQGPVPVDAPDLVYTAEDDKVIDEFIGQTGTSFLDLLE